MFLSFWQNQQKIIFLGLGLLILSEGLVYSFFPEKVREMVSNSPDWLLRLAGILTVVASLGFILLSRLT